MKIYKEILVIGNGVSAVQGIAKALKEKPEMPVITCNYGYNFGYLFRNHLFNIIADKRTLIAILNEYKERKKLNEHFKLPLNWVRTFNSWEAIQKLIDDNNAREYFAVYNGTCNSGIEAIIHAHNKAEKVWITGFDKYPCDLFAPFLNSNANNMSIELERFKKNQPEITFDYLV